MKKENIKVNNKIDFVILWVDGSDPKWLNEKKKYDTSLDVDDFINRYRDWDNLKYWFRGVEEFAPWVNKIHFVTWGHIPKFLNVNHEKINIVKHEQICDEAYLPLFNSNAIEMNINKIEGLENNFVYFNDDMFIIDKTQPQDFFKNNKPCDEYAESPIIVTDHDDVFPHLMLNNMSVINRKYKKAGFFKSNKYLYFNRKYGKNNIRTLSQTLYHYYTGFYNPHIPQAFKKEYFDRLWKEEKELVKITIKNRFRAKTDITQYLIRYMQLLDGNFVPRSSKFGKNFEISSDNKKLIEHIKKQKSKVICLNDTNTNIDYETSKDEINQAFEQILSKKSSFEL